MSFPPGFLDELKARVGLADIVGRRVRLTRRGREHTGLCPFHNEKSPSFSVNEQKGFYHCFGCGAHGSVFDFVMQTEGVGFPEAVERLAAEAGMELPRRTPEDRQASDRRERLLACVEAAAKWFQAQLAGERGRIARAYLERRGVPAEQVERFRLGYAPDSRGLLKDALAARGFEPALQVEAGLLAEPEDGEREPYDRFRHRLIFPIEDRAGRVIAFGGRALGEARAKYLNSPETPLFHKGHQLYNLPRARQAAHDKGRLVVVEGYMDVIALDRAGIAEAVAPLGTALGEDQMRLLWKLEPEPVLCFDGDAAGQRAAARAAERALPLLQGGQSFRFALLPTGHDPDSLVADSGSRAMEAVVEVAVPLVELLWREELARRTLDTPERWADLRQRLQGLANRVADPALRKYYRDDFGHRLAEERNARYGRARPVLGRQAFSNERKAAGSLLELLTVHIQSEELALLWMIVRSPHAMAEVWEDLAGANFSSANIDEMRASLVTSFSSGGSIEATGFLNRLEEVKNSHEFKKLVGNHKLSLPVLEKGQVSQDWLNVWERTLHNRMRLSGLEADWFDARAEYARMVERGVIDEAYSNALRRLSNIQDAIANARKDMVPPEEGSIVAGKLNPVEAVLAEIERNRSQGRPH